MDCCVKEIEERYGDVLLDQLFAISCAPPLLRAEFSRVLRHWAELNYACYLELRQHPPYKAIETDLKKIQAHAAELSILLSKRHVEYEIWCAADEHENDPASGIDIVWPAKNVVKNLEKWSIIARKRVNPKKLGRQSEAFRNKARQAAVDELGLIWERLTGTPPTRRNQSPANTDNPQPYGPFQDFVQLALLPIFGSNGIKGIDRDIRMAVRNIRSMDKTCGAQVPGYIHFRRFS